MMAKKVRKLQQLIPRLHRVGITHKKLPLVLKILKTQKTTHLIDVRYSTLYKSKQGFSPQHLEKVLGQANITYTYYQKLGNPFHREFTQKLKTAINPKEIRQVHDEARQEYLNFIRSERKNLIQLIFKKIAHTRATKEDHFCFMCYCDTSNPLRCHTYWLIEEMINLKRVELDLPPDYQLPIPMEEN